MPRQDIKKLPGARKSPLPKFVAPQLATLVKEPPSGAQWLHELKFDGYRMLCRIDRGRVTIWSRNGKDWTLKFLNVIESVKSLNVASAILDGEIVIVDAQGRSSFLKLQRAMSRTVTSGFVYQVFDLIYLDGFNLTKTPLKDRKQLLSDLCKSVAGTSIIRYSEHYQGDGEEFFRHACQHGIEGIVSKLANSTYESTRSHYWLKVKCSKRQEFVIVGYTPSSKGLPGFGSLVLGVYEKAKLIYAGRVGTGFTFKQRREIKKKLEVLSRETSPLFTVPKDPTLRETKWIEPEIVAEVAFLEWTPDGIRHPSFQGLRDDKSRIEVICEDQQPDSHKAKPKSKR